MQVLLIPIILKKMFLDFMWLQMLPNQKMSNCLQTPRLPENSNSLLSVHDSRLECFYIMIYFERNFLPLILSILCYNANEVINK